MDKKTIYAVGTLAILAGIMGFVMLRAHPPVTAPVPTDTTSGTPPSVATGSPATTPVQTGTRGIISSDSGVSTSMPEPDLNRLYTPPTNAPKDIQAQDAQAVKDAVTQLKLDPNHIAYWLQLASYRKLGGDYTGAEEVWLYCTARWPTDVTAYNNLADLYGSYMHEYDKAVIYWKKVIALQPTDTDAYANLATLYGANMLDTADAKVTIEAGLKAAPHDPRLMSLEAQYQ